MSTSTLQSPASTRELEMVSASRASSQDPLPPHSAFDSTADELKVRQVPLSVSFAFQNKERLTGTKRAFAHGWQPVNWSLAQFTNHVTSGNAFAVAQFEKGYRDKKSCKTMQIVCVDLDEGPSVDTLLAYPFIKAHAFLIYPTASSTPENPRTRVCFCFDQAINDSRQYEIQVLSLMQHLKTLGLKPDGACKDASRMFYGSTQPGWILQEHATLPLAVLQAFDDQAEKSTRSTPTSRRAAKRQTRKQIPTSSDPLAGFLEHEIRSALSVIPVQQAYEDWLKVLMAVHSVLPDARGVQLIEAWSPGKEGEVEAKFRSFDKGCDNPVTINTLWHLARKHGWSPVPSVKPDVEFHSHYVSDAKLDLSGACIIKSDMVTGKTEVVKQLIAKTEQELQRPIRVLLLSHRVALVTVSAERLGLESYADLPSDRMSQAPKLAITPNSIHLLFRSSRCLPAYDLIIIDEIEQFLGHLVGETFKGSAGVTAFSALENLIRRADMVLALDAHAGELSRRFMQSIRSDTMFYENRYHPPKGELSLCSSKDELLTTIRDRVLEARGPVAVACEHARDVEEYAAYFATIFGEDKVMAVHSKNSGQPGVRDFIQNINQKVLHYRLIFYSSTIGTGIDVQTPIDTLFGSFHGDTLSPEEQLQMLGRFRKVGKTIVHLQSRQARRETRREVLYKRELARMLTTGAQCNFDLSGNCVINQQQEKYLQLYCDVTAAHHQSMNDGRRRFLELAQINYTLIEGETMPTGLGEQVKEMTRERKALQQERTLTAEPVDAAAYDAAQKQGVVSDELEAGHTRWRVEQTYGLPITPELLAIWNGGKGEQQMNAFLDFMASEAAMIARDRQQHASLVPYFRRDHATFHWICWQEFFNTVFEGGFHTDELPEKDLLERAARADAALQAQFGSDYALHLGRRPSQPSTPLHILRHCLNQVGLRLKRKPKGKARDRFVYCLDAETLAFMERTAKRRRAQQGKVGDQPQAESPYSDAGSAVAALLTIVAQGTGTPTSETNTLRAGYTKSALLNPIAQKSCTPLPRPTVGALDTLC